jgi:hypothetical protein
MPIPAEASGPKSTWGYFVGRIDDSPFWATDSFYQARVPDRLICKTDEAHVRRVIHAFNDFSFESLNPKVGTGWPRKFEPATRDRIVAIALAPPTTVGDRLPRRFGESGARAPRAPTTP